MLHDRTIYIKQEQMKELMKKFQERSETLIVIIMGKFLTQWDHFLRFDEIQSHRNLTDHPPTHRYTYFVLQK